MTYPDTTRAVYVGIQSAELVEAATMYAVHSMNEPAHTLQNGIIIPQENTGTRMQDNGQARGKRGSSIRIQAYLRLDEIGIWLESALGAGSTVNHPNPIIQNIDLTGTPTGGTFTLFYDDQETGTIAFDATTGAVDAALEALSNIPAGGVAVTGSPGAWVVTFTGGLADNNIMLVLGDNNLTGGTSPDVDITADDITGAYLRTYRGGVVRGLPLTIKFFNGLYWRRMIGCRVNTMNVQGFGNQLAMIDMELIGRASVKIAAPTPIEVDDTFVPIDVPMQSVAFDGTTDADMDRMSIQISNNLTTRSPMDGTTSVGRTRFGFFTITLDGMADYPAYEGSLYEAFELNTPVGDMELIMLDDLHTMGTPAINPYVIFKVSQPLLADMTEGSDGGELVQMIKGRGMYKPSDAAGLVVQLANNKPSSYYAAS